MIYGQVLSACLPMLRKNEGHCLTYGQRRGGGRVWAVFYYDMFFCKVSSLRKRCGMLAERLAECLKSLIFNDFIYFIPLILLMKKYIELLSFLSAKIVPRGSGGQRGHFFVICGISGKKSIKCLIFKDLLHSANFPHPLRRLSAYA